MAIIARQINGQMVYTDENGNAYTAEQVKQGNTNRDGGFFSGIADAVSGWSDSLTEKYQQQAETLYKATQDEMATSYDYWKDTNADDNMELASAAKMLNMDPQTAFMAAEETQDSFKEMAKTPQIDWNDMEINMPQLYQYLSDQENMAKSHDDIENLSFLDRAGQEISDAYDVANYVYRLNEIDNQADNEGKTIDELSEDLKEERRRLQYNIETLQKRSPQGLLGAVTQMFTSMGNSLANTGLDIASSAAAGAVMGSVIPVIGTVSGAVGGAAVALAKDQGAQAKGEMYRRLLSMGATKEGAARGAAIYGVGNFALNVPFFQSVGLASKIARAATTTGLLKKIGVNTLEQSFLGALTGVLDVSSEKIGMGRTPFSWSSSDAERVGTTAAEMAAFGSLLSLPGYGWAAMRRLAQAVDNTKTVKRDPAGTAEYIDKVTNNHEVAIPSEAIARYITEETDDNGEAILNALGTTREELNRAVQVGDDINVSMGKILVMPEEQRQAFYADMKVDGNPSARMMQEAADGDVPEPLPDRPQGEADADATSKLMEEEANEITTTVDAEVENERTYLASNLLEGKPNEAQAKDSLQFNLQLFGHKTAKKVAKEYDGGKLTPEAEAEFEKIAQKYGYSSGSEMAKDILAKNEKSKEKAVRAEKAINAAKAEAGVDEEGMKVRKSLTDENTKSIAKESAEMDEQSNGSIFDDAIEMEDTAENWKENAQKSKDAEAQKKKAGIFQSLFDTSDMLYDTIDSIEKETKAKKKAEADEKRESFFQSIFDASDMLYDSLDSMEKETQSMKSDIMDPLMAADEMVFGERIDAKSQRIRELKSQIQDLKRYAKLERKFTSIVVENAVKKEKNAQRQAALKKLSDRYKTILKDVGKEMKDTQEMRAARVGAMKVRHAKWEAALRLHGMPVSEAANFYKLFQASKKKRAEAEWAYRKAMAVKSAAMAQPVVESTAKVQRVNETKGEMPDVITEEKPRITKAEWTTTEKREQRIGERAHWLQRAREAKEQELVLHIMAQEAVHIRDRVTQVNRTLTKAAKALPKDIQKANKGKTTLSKGDENYNQMGSLLEKFGFLTRNVDWTPQPNMGTFADWITNMNGKTGGVRIADWIQNDMQGSGVRKFGTLTIGEVEDVYNAFRNMRHVANIENKMLSESRKESIDQLRATMIDEMKGPVKYKRSQETDNKNRAHRLSYDMLTMDTILSTHFGEDSEIYKFFILHKRELDNKERALTVDISNKLEAIDNRYTKQEKKAMEKKQWIPEINVNLTKSQMISIAMNLGTEGNRAKLFPEDKKNWPVDLEDATMWDENICMEILNKYLTKKDWETVQKRWDALAELRPLVEEHEKRITGFTPKMVEPYAFIVQTADGPVKMKGGYYPLGRDFRSANAGANRDEIQGTPLSMLNSPKGTAATVHGFTKERTNAEYSVSLDPGLMARHITDVIHDYYFRDYIADANRIALTNDDFKNAFYAQTGRAGEESLKNYIASVAGTAYRDAGLAMSNWFMTYLRKVMGKSSIVLNFPVIVQNLANAQLYAGAVKGFTMGNVLHALGTYGPEFMMKAAFNWRNAEKYLGELSPYMQSLFNSPDMSLRAIQERGVVQKNKGIRAFSAHLMWMTDAIASVPMWKEMYAKTLRETGDKAKAIQQADLLIQRVNGSPNKADQSQFMRSDNGFYGIMNMFMGFFNTEYNRWYREAARFMKKPVSNAPGLLMFAASRMFGFALLSELLMGKGPEDDENPISWAIRKGLQYPLSLNVYTKELPGAIDYAMGEGDEVYGYRGTSLLQPLASLSNTGSAWGRLIDKGGKAELESALESTGRTAAYWTGTPQWLSALFWNSYDYVENGMDWTYNDFFKRRPAKER